MKFDFTLPNGEIVTENVDEGYINAKSKEIPSPISYGHVIGIFNDAKRHAEDEPKYAKNLQELDKSVSHVINTIKGRFKEIESSEKSNNAADISSINEETISVLDAKHGTTDQDRITFGYNNRKSDNKSFFKDKRSESDIAKIIDDAMRNVGKVGGITVEEPRAFDIRFK